MQYYRKKMLSKLFYVRKMSIKEYKKYLSKLLIVPHTNNNLGL